MELKLYNTTSSKLNSLNIIGGQLIVSKDDSCLYIDIDSIGRLKITDWIELETDNDRLAVLAPISGKIYYVSETNAIWKYVKGSWKCLNEVNKEEIFEYVLENLQSYLDAKVPTSRKINGKVLTSDIALSAADVGALTTSDISIIKSEVNDYTDQQIANLLHNSTEAVDSIYELRDAMEENADAIESLVAISGNKANASDLTSHINNQNNPHNVTKEQLGLYVSIWVGTKAERDALPTIEDDCLYIVTDDNPEIQWEDLSNKVTELNNSVTHDQYPSARAVWNILSNLNQYEKIANKVTVINENSTDEQFPSAKAVYEGCFTVANQVAQEAEKLSNKTTSITTSSTDVQYPSAKAVNTLVTNTKNSILQTVGTKVTTISDNSTDTEYPTAKAVNTVIKDKVDAVIPELQESITEGLTNVVRTTEEAVMQAKFVAQSNSDYMVRQVRNILISESEPSVDDMEDGDICIVI